MQEFILQSLQFQSQTYLLHWQTKSYARHMAYGSTNAALGGLVDNFVEVYQGRYGRIKLTEDTSLKIRNLGAFSETEAITNYRDFLANEVSNQLNPETDSDLQNILDEMVGMLNKLLYLLTLE